METELGRRGALGGGIIPLLFAAATGTATWTTIALRLEMIADALTGSGDAASHAAR